ncbi:hypothetical protein B9Z55_024456 [Caenorhabditis nigoni]|uniref:DUF281 domain-containing protein n=1 Tax=Caenorhabditis nigoni TaxID=1611254 RepID=A0A2G5SUL2_9PELO|nr:hypothetical protein B9Z55_024456 [Caenorhabditis nigoni]
MRFCVGVFVISWLKVLDSCIPTQFVNNDGSLGSRPTTLAPGATTTTVPGAGSGTTSSSTTTTTTTTMSTTTTTVTEFPFPCNNCPKVYDNTCQGFGIPNLLQWCPTAAEAAIEYTLGLITSIFPFIPSGSCGTIITCPLTTALRIKILGAEIPAPVFYAWCEESGPRVGKCPSSTISALTAPATTTSTTPSTTTATTTTTSTTTTTTATTTTSTTTTTTTMTTTTTVLTEAPFPCTGCAKIYDTACQGFGIPSIFDWCPQAAEVGVTYFLGAVAALPFLPQNSCSTTIVCPPGTTPRINLFGSSIPAPTPATLAYCEETGPNAGKWYTGAPPFSFELSSLTCQNIASG